VPVSFADLVNLQAVKDRLPTVGAGSDTVITSLIKSVSREVQIALERPLAEQDFVDYLDGHGDERLMLNFGPLVTFTSLNYVTYGSDGAGARTETLTLIATGNFVEGGKRDEGSIGRGWIELLAGEFLPGTRNYKAAYKGGFATIPEDIQGVAIDLVVASYQSRESSILADSSIGESSMRGFDTEKRRKHIRSALAKYVLAPAFVR
jgi:hypothetical protein